MLNVFNTQLLQQFQHVHHHYRDHLDASSTIDVSNHRQNDVNNVCFFFSIFIYTLLIITYKDYTRVRTGTTMTTDDEEQ